VPARVSTRSPALTRRWTIRVAASEDTCNESWRLPMVITGTALCTISSRTVRTTSARRAVSRRSAAEFVGRLSTSGPSFRQGRNGVSSAMSGLGGDDLLENVRHAQGEQIDGFVHPICAHSPAWGPGMCLSAGFIGLPQPCDSLSVGVVRLSHLGAGSAPNQPRPACNGFSISRPARNFTHVTAFHHDVAPEKRSHGEIL